MTGNLNAQQFYPSPGRSGRGEAVLWAQRTMRKGPGENPFFEQTDTPDLALKYRGYVETDEHVPLGVLKSTQPTYIPAKVESLRGVPSADLPPVKVTNVDGAFWLLDGNHRAIRDLEEGAATIAAKVRRPRDIVVRS